MTHSNGNWMNDDQRSSVRAAAREATRLRWEHASFQACYWSASSVACDGAKWIIEIASDGMFDARLIDAPTDQEASQKSPNFSQLDSAKAWCQQVEDAEPAVIGWDKESAGEIVEAK